MSVTATAASRWGWALGQCRALCRAGVRPAGAEKRSGSPPPRGPRGAPAVPLAWNSLLPFPLVLSPQVVVRCHLCGVPCPTSGNLPGKDRSGGEVQTDPASPRVRGRLQTPVCWHYGEGRPREKGATEGGPLGPLADPRGVLSVRLQGSWAENDGWEQISATPLQGDGSELEARGQRACKHLRFFFETLEGPHLRRKLTS